MLTVRIHVLDVVQRLAIENIGCLACVKVNRHHHSWRYAIIVYGAEYRSNELHTDTHKKIVTKPTRLSLITFLIQMDHTF